MLPTLLPTLLRTRRAKLSALFTAAVVAASAAAIVAAPAPIYARPAPLDLGPAIGPAAAWIDTVLARLRARPADPADPRPVTHVHYQQYSQDNIDPTDVFIHDVHQFWAPDRSARRYDVSLSPADADAVRARTPRDGFEVTEPGQFPLAFGTLDLSADPAVLATQLAMNEPPANGPQVLPRAVTAAASLFHLTTGQRIALLTLIRDAGTALSHGTVTDRAGRQGTALSIASGDPDRDNQPTTRVSDILIIDDDGQLLAHELVAVDPLPAHPDMDVPAVLSYTLILTTARVPTLP